MSQRIVFYIGSSLVPALLLALSVSVVRDAVRRLGREWPFSLLVVIGVAWTITFALSFVLGEAGERASSLLALSCLAVTLPFWFVVRLITAFRDKSGRG